MMQLEKFDSVSIKYLNNLKEENIKLVSSKSESNRALIINALASGSGMLGNLSEARDTQTMMKLLATTSKTWDVLDAGTTMRFLTGYAAANGLNKVLTGTERMQQRPIKILVDALREIGVVIKYLKEDGYPPIEIVDFPSQLTNHIKVRGDVSSQYISALAMIAPTLPNGLTIELTGRIGSKPYIEMTLELMRKFGAHVSFNEHIIQINPVNYSEASYIIESDWSGASYWFSFAALADHAKIKLLGLRENSLQGDIAIVKIMDHLGVEASFDHEGVSLSKKAMGSIDKIDFTHCPDLAQTVCVTLAATGKSCELVGLESLRIKETDRIAALQNELSKFGGYLDEINSSSWKLIPSDQNIKEIKGLKFHSYEDHRMAMAFAPLAAITNIEIDEPFVVKKSYPGYWEDLKKVGFELKFNSYSLKEENGK